MNNNIVSIDNLIGKTVLSRATGNTLGEVYDLYIDPVKGLLVGLTVKAPNGVMGGLDYKNIYSFGNDAVMANEDDSIVPLKDDWLDHHPQAKKNLSGVNIVTESGNLLGQVANIFVRLTPPPVAVYEIRESVLDKLLGRNFFIFASEGRALSRNAERIVVPNDAKAHAASGLTELIALQNTQPLAAAPALQNRNDAETIIKP